MPHAATGTASVTPPSSRTMERVSTSGRPFEDVRIRMHPTSMQLAKTKRVARKGRSERRRKRYIFGSSIIGWAPGGGAGFQPQHVTTALIRSSSFLMSPVVKGTKDTDTCLSVVANLAAALEIPAKRSDADRVCCWPNRTIEDANAKSAHCETADILVDAAAAQNLSTRYEMPQS